MCVYRERASARCDGCDSRLLFPFVCVNISPGASYSPPSGSAVRGMKGEAELGRKSELSIQMGFQTQQLPSL